MISRHGEFKSSLRCNGKLDSEFNSGGKVSVTTAVLKMNRNILTGRLLRKRLICVICD